jgi:hypothetical protein
MRDHLYGELSRLLSGGILPRSDHRLRRRGATGPGVASPAIVALFIATTDPAVKPQALPVVLELQAIDEAGAKLLDAQGAPARTHHLLDERNPKVEPGVPDL